MFLRRYGEVVGNGVVRWTGGEAEISVHRIVWNVLIDEPARKKVLFEYPLHQPRRSGSDPASGRSGMTPAAPSTAVADISAHGQEVAATLAHIDAALDRTRPDRARGR